MRSVMQQYNSNFNMALVGTLPCCGSQFAVRLVFDFFCSYIKWYMKKSHFDLHICRWVGVALQGDLALFFSSVKLKIQYKIIFP